MLLINNLLGELRKKSFHSFSMNVMEKGMAMMLQLILARILLVEGYGVYSYTMTIISLLVIVAQLGTQTYVTREVSKYSAKGDIHGIKSTLITTFTALSVMSMLVMGSVFLYANLYGVDNEIIDVITIAALLIPAIVIIGLHEKIYMAVRRVFVARSPNALVVPFVSLVLIILLGNVTLYDVFYIRIFSYSLVVLFVVGYFVKKFVKHNNIEFKFRFKELFSVSLPMLFASTVQLLNTRIDVLMIGMFLQMDDVGIYSVAAQLSTLILFGLMSINSVFSPMISAQFHLGNFHTLETMCMKVSKWATIFALVIFIIIVFAGELLLSFYGDEFKTGYDVLIILSATQIINAFFGPVGVIMVMTGRQNMYLFQLSTSVLLNVILNSILIKHFGVIGASISTAVAIIVWNVLMYLYVRRTYNINTAFAFSGLRKSYEKNT
jgi:O-antigen/teichoic acid export membrane protein